jgi:hypothetical protein
LGFFPGFFFRGAGGVSVDGGANGGSKQNAQEWAALDAADGARLVIGGWRSFLAV